MSLGHPGPSLPTPLEANERLRRAAATAGAALLLGILADRLFVGRLGLNWGLWVALVVLALLGLSRALRVALRGEGRWMLAVGAVFACCVAWRASSTLAALNLLATLFALGLACAATREGRLVTARVGALLLAWVQAIVGAGTDALGLVFVDVPWSALPKPRSNPALAGVARGLVIAVPVLAVFAALFASADAVFGRLVRSLFSVELRADELIWHAVVVLFWAFLAAAFLRRSLVAQRVLEFRSSRLASLGQTEMVTVLGLVVALFAAFVVVQVGYLFGGLSQISVTGLTYSDYARRGFFELVTVASLTLPLLLALQSLIPDDRPGQTRAFGVLALILVGLLAVVMLSAAQRMRLYVLEYGLTELRLYPVAFMVWLALVFGWYVWTLVRRDRDRFAFGAVAAAALVLLTLNAINPNALIVRYNAARATVNATITSDDTGSRSGAGADTLDLEYALQLGADAVPALLEVLEARKEPVAQGYKRTVLERWQDRTPDWREWNWGEWQAIAATRARAER